MLPYQKHTTKPVTRTHSTTLRVTQRQLHVAPILPPHHKHGLGNLPEGAVFGGFHEGGEDVLVVQAGLLYVFEQLAAFGGVALPECFYGGYLGLLLVVGAADDLLRQHGGRALFAQVRVHADDGELAGVL